MKWYRGWKKVQKLMLDWDRDISRLYKDLNRLRLRKAQWVYSMESGPKSENFKSNIF